MWVIIKHLVVVAPEYPNLHARSLVVVDQCEEFLHRYSWVVVPSDCIVHVAVRTEWRVTSPPSRSEMHDRIALWTADQHVTWDLGYVYT